MYDCKHLDQIDPQVTPKTPDGCEECLAQKKPWNELRICLTCGHVGCCDNSFGKHASAHYQETGHPIMASYQSTTQFQWCYADDIPVETVQEA